MPTRQKQCSSFLAAASVLFLAGQAGATALTALLPANQRSCYYADVDGAGEKVGEWSRTQLKVLTESEQASTLRCSPEETLTLTMW